VSFSPSSYVLGVGTVVGALAFGFGGGVVLTNTAKKTSPPTETRAERVSRAEPLPAVSSQSLDVVTAVSTPAPPLPISSTPEALANSGAAKYADDKKASELTAQPLPPTTVQSTKPVERSAKADGPKKPEPREAANRKFARQKRETERQPKDMARAKHRQFERLEPQNRVFAFERQEPRPNFFELPLFGRSRGGSFRDED
jgi:hypothetical protein